MLQKLRYSVTITSVLSVVFLILESLEIINLTEGESGTIINSIVSVLVMLGIAIAPSKKEKVVNKDNIKVDDVVENSLIKDSIEEIKEIIKDSNQDDVVENIEPEKED